MASADEHKSDSDSKLRVLVTASGLLGRAVFAEFQKHSEKYTVKGTAFSRATDTLIKVDLCDPEAVSACIRDFKPHAIIHAAAERRPDVCEGDEAATTALNVSAPAVIGKVASDVGAWVLYISTDYVFDGRTPPYKVTDTPNPLNAYGVSKYEGEKSILAALPSAGVLRVPVLFGHTKKLEESAVTVLARGIVDNSRKPVDAWAQRFPTFCDDVAVVIRQLADVAVDPEQAPDKTSGIFHWSGGERLTKFDQAKLMAKLLDKDPSTIEAAEGPPSGATRPRDCEMDTSRLETMGIGQRTPVAEALAVVLRNSGAVTGASESA